jgi:hypothetical protein
MNKKQKLKLCILACSLPLFSKAQLQVGLNVGANLSTIYNKADIAADERLSLLPTIKPAIGTEIMYGLDKKNAIGIGFYYIGAGQRYKSSPAVNSGYTAIKDNIQLHYLHIPIYGSFTLGNPIRSTSSIIFGSYLSYLSSYKQVINHTYTPNANNPIASELIFEKKTLTNNLSYNVNGTIANSKQSLNMDADVFNKIDVGFMLGYNKLYKINNKLNFSASVIAKYGLAQVDNVDSIKVTDPTNPTNSGYYTIKTYTYCRDNVTTSNTEPLRDPKSNNILVGLQFGLIYKFGNNKNF